MQTQSNDIERAALGMEPERRARLAARLIRSLPEEAVAEVDEAEIERLWLEEVERRIERVEAGKEELIPAEQVLQELRNRHG